MMSNQSLLNSILGNLTRPGFLSFKIFLRAVSFGKGRPWASDPVEGFITCWKAGQRERQSVCMCVCVCVIDKAIPTECVCVCV